MAAIRRRQFTFNYDTIGTFFRQHNIQLSSNFYICGMFLDEKTIEVRSGKGGDGIVSFHREKFVPLGGPDGGDGGRGGHVILRVNEQYSTLLDMGNARLYKAKNGQPGGAKRCTGASADDLIVDVPRGTIVKDAEGRILADLTEAGQKWIAARGGKGGMGNQHFATPKVQAPRKVWK